LRQKRKAYPRRSPSRALSRHPACRRVSGLPRPYREVDALGVTGGGKEYWNQIDRELRDVARRKRQRTVFRPSRIEIFCGGQTRAGSGARLSAKERPELAANRALARPLPGL